MIIICEECGRKYRINPANIRGRAASFKCRSCAHTIVVKKAQPTPSPPAPEQASDPRDTSESVTTTVDDGAATAVAKSGASQARRSRGKRRFGLRAKMLVLFLFIPMIIMAGVSLFYIWQFEITTDLLARQSAGVINRMAEEKIADIAAAVAMQCRLYLLSHPELKKENFSKDIGFTSLAVQKVGLTGYTWLYELPGTDGIWRTWAHINPKIIAIDMSTLKKPFKGNFPGFWKILIGIKGGRKSQGYYTWQDKDHSVRDKFMVCTPIAGTRFVIAATTYMDEFTGPVSEVESSAKNLTGKAKMFILAVLGVTLLLIGLTVSIYGHRLIGKIKSLTEVADRIGVGELGTKIETNSKDEIGDLAEAIARMQNNIRLSTEGLRRRR